MTIFATKSDQKTMRSARDAVKGERKDGEKECVRWHSMYIIFKFMPLDKEIKIKTHHFKHKVELKENKVSQDLGTEKLGKARWESREESAAHSGTTGSGPVPRKQQAQLRPAEGTPGAEPPAASRAGPWKCCPPT